MFDFEEDVLSLKEKQMTLSNYKSYLVRQLNKLVSVFL